MSLLNNPFKRTVKKTVEVNVTNLLKNLCNSEFIKYYSSNNETVNLNYVLSNIDKYYEIIKQFYDKRYLFKTRYNSLTEEQKKLFWFDSDYFVEQDLDEKIDNNIYDFDKINTHNTFVEIFNQNDKIGTNIFEIQVNTIVKLLNFLTDCNKSKLLQLEKDYVKKIEEYKSENTKQLLKISQDCHLTQEEYNNIIKELESEDEIIEVKTEEKVTELEREILIEQCKNKIRDTNNTNKLKIIDKEQKLKLIKEEIEFLSKKMLKPITYLRLQSKKNKNSATRKLNKKKELKFLLLKTNKRSKRKSKPIPIPSPSASAKTIQSSLFKDSSYKPINNDDFSPKEILKVESVTPLKESFIHT
jgi:hypothetical protein